MQEIKCVQTHICYPQYTSVFVQVYCTFLQKRRENLWLAINMCISKVRANVGFLIIHVHIGLRATVCRSALITFHFRETKFVIEKVWLSFLLEVICSKGKMLADMLH